MPEKERGKLLSPDHFSLVLTGQRGTEGQRRRLHLVVFCGKRVGLTNGPFVLLLELARARLETHTGYLCLPPRSDPEVFRLGVHRLRRQIDACLGSGAGMKSIETGVGTEYRLTVPPDHIGIDPGFSELAWPLIPRDLRDRLVQQCPEVKVEELCAITVKSD